MKLADTFIRHVVSNDKVQKYLDGGELFLYATPTGKNSWRLAYRFADRQKLLSLGPYPSVSLREAREKREEAKKLLRKHIDPSEARRQAKKAAAEASRNSFEDVAREWYAKHSAQWVPAYQKTFIRIMEDNLFPYIGKRPINDITPRELLTVIRRVEERGALTIATRPCVMPGEYSVMPSPQEEPNMMWPLPCAAHFPPCGRNTMSPSRNLLPWAICCTISMLTKITSLFPAPCGLRLWSSCESMS